MVMVKLRLATLVPTRFQSIISVRPRFSRRDKKRSWLSVIVGGGMVTMVVHRHFAGFRIKIVGKGNIRRLAGRSANCQSRIGAAIRPHVRAWPIQDLDTSFINAD